MPTPVPIESSDVYIGHTGKRSVKKHSVLFVHYSVDCWHFFHGFLPSNYIGSGALSKSLTAVSEKDTGLVPEDNQNPFGFVHLIPT